MARYKLLFVQMEDKSKLLMREKENGKENLEN